MADIKVNERPVRIPENREAIEAVFALSVYDQLCDLKEQYQKVPRWNLVKRSRIRRKAIRIKTNVG